MKRCCEGNRELDTLALFLLQPHCSLSLKAEKKKKSVSSRPLSWDVFIGHFFLFCFVAEERQNIKLWRKGDNSQESNQELSGTWIFFQVKIEVEC